MLQAVIREVSWWCRFAPIQDVELFEGRPGAFRGRRDEPIRAGAAEGDATAIGLARFLRQERTDSGSDCVFLAATLGALPATGRLRSVERPGG